MYPSLKKLTDKEKLILQEFREMVSSLLKPEHDDLYLLKWLKAVSFDKEKAEEMLRKHFTEFRKEYGIDSILNAYEFPEVVRKYQTQGFLGFDKEGNPVRIGLLNEMDCKGILKSVSEKDSVQILFYLLEMDIKARKENNAKTGKWAEKNIYIFNAENVNISPLVTKENIKWCLRILRLYLNNYPETLKWVIAINAPPLVYYLQKVFSSFVKHDVMNKGKIFGTEGWKEFLLDMMDPEILPAFLGGTRTDPDGNPLCLTVIPRGGRIIPEEYYLANKERLSPEEENVHSTVIDIKSSFAVEVPIEDADTILFWKFQTEKFDLGFALSYKKSLTTEDKELEVMVPMKRENCSPIPSEGMHVCDEPGVYVLQFDNSYSWMNEKKLLYKVEIALSNNISEYLEETTIEINE